MIVCPQKSHHVSATAGSGPATTVVNIPIGSEKEGASAWVSHGFVQPFRKALCCMTRGCRVGGGPVCSLLSQVVMAKLCASYWC